MAKNAKKHTAECPLYKKCGGCQLQNMTYPEQLAYKQRKEERWLSKFCHVEPIIGMEDPHHYRNKVQAAFAWDQRHRKVISGVYQSGSHSIVPVNDCLIEDRKADEIIVDIRRLMTSFKMQPYDEDSRRGFLRHVLVKRGFSTGQIMVVLVTGTPMFPSRRNFLKALLELHPDITTIIQNVNPYRTNLVLGKQEQVLYGPGYIEDTLCGCTFRISAKSFYQINPVQCEKLYRTAIDYAGLTGNETLFDSYCGTGTIGIIAAKQAKNVIGVELNRDAVKDAISNAKRNDINNIRFICGDAGNFPAFRIPALRKAEGCAGDDGSYEERLRRQDEVFQHTNCLLYGFCILCQGNQITARYCILKHSAQTHECAVPIPDTGQDSA